MTLAGKVVIGITAIALAYGIYACGSRMYSWMKGPTPGSRAWQIQEFRKDWRACDRFAGKREEARKLLAWRPQPPYANPPGSDGWKKEFEERLSRQAAEARANLDNLDVEMREVAARWQADELDCLRDLDWPDGQIESLKREIREADKAKQ